MSVTLIHMAQGPLTAYHTPFQPYQPLKQPWVRVDKVYGKL